MKYYKDVTSTRKVLDYSICDMCQSKFHNQIVYGFNYTGSEVSLTTGKVYPECDCRVKKSVDICSDCFENKLIPWLESQGCTIEEAEME